MKRLITTAFLLLFWACMNAQTVEPSAKVQAAFSAKELASKTEDEILLLNITADHLCWFEEVKVENTSETFQLTDKKGNTVLLTESDLANFNPYLYNLPQDDFVCQNLVIVTAEGTKHLLIVRSVSMMEKKIEQEKTRLNKKK